MHKVCIDVGHTPTAPGAVAKNGKTEYQQNVLLANKLAVELHAAGIIPVVVYRQTYSTLPYFINATFADICISIHANAADTQLATGTETLYYHKSAKSKSLAEIVQKNMHNCLCIRDRGLKPRHPGHRGYDLLAKTSMPHVIVEPYFLSNASDVEIATNKMDELARSISDACEIYLGSEK